ncbi:MAG: hypothetical protein OEV44_09050 [Spirochaetota bacterium]|nr:hypothetical protein [Spirochaetota bacterium]
MRVSTKELSQVIILHKKTKNREDADKLEYIVCCCSGWNWRKISEVLFVTDGTIKIYEYIRG